MEIVLPSGALRFPRAPSPNLVGLAAIVLTLIGLLSGSTEVAARGIEALSAIASEQPSSALFARAKQGENVLRLAQTTPPAAQPDATQGKTGPTAQFDDPRLVSRSGKILLAMLVLAIVIESALSVIFNWRVFLEFFDGRGVKTVVMLVVSGVVVYAFDQDFVHQLLAVYGSAGEGARSGSNAGTLLLSALVLAGGSASVNQLMVALGIRDNRSAERIEARPKPDKAWVSFKLVTSKDERPAPLPFRILTVAAPNGAPPPAIVGGSGLPDPLTRLRQYFLRDTHRFPRSQGHEVEKDLTYAFVIEDLSKSTSRFFDIAGNELTFSNGADFNPAPKPVRFAPGAIVDFVVKVTH